jgi:tetratricopeptide (TPR) repeat protein
MDRFEQAWEYNERALAAAERAGEHKTVARAAGSLGLITVFGPVPADEGIERCRALRARVLHLTGSYGHLLRYEAVLQAMRGHFDEARALSVEADRIVYGLGVPWSIAGRAFGQCTIEMLAGAPDRAEAVARESLGIFESMGATNQGSTAAALLALALARQGRHDEALTYADLAAEWAVPDDIASQVGQLGARACALAAHGELERAEEAAREGVRLSERSDELSQRGDALVVLAPILERRGDAEGAATALRDAIALYGRKGNVVGARRARAMLGQLQPLGAGE